MTSSGDSGCNAMTSPSLQAWAEVSGNGRAQGDPSVWKRNFRSALRVKGFKMVTDNKNDAANPHKVFLWPDESASGGEDQRRPPFGPFYCSRQLKKATISCDDLHKKRDVYSDSVPLSLCFTHAELFSLCILTVILGRGGISWLFMSLDCKWDETQKSDNAVNAPQMLLI